MSSAPQPRQVLVPACLPPTFSVSLVVSYSSMRSLFPTFSQISCTAASALTLWLCLCELSQLCHLFSPFLLFSAVLPVCRAPYFTPTGTNSPQCSNFSVILRCCMLSFPSPGELAAVFTRVCVFVSISDNGTTSSFYIVAVPSVFLKKKIKLIKTGHLYPSSS